jgi:hypothetical protein
VASKAYFAIYAAFLCPSVSATPAETSAAAKQQISQALGSLLQADGRRARDQLQSLNLIELSAKDTKFRNCVLARLRAPTPVRPINSPQTRKPDKFVRRLLTLYRTYWWTSVMRPDARADAERRLAAQVAGLLGRPTTTIDGMEPLIKNRLKQAGFYSLQGKTGKLYELMIWSRQDEKVEKVILPEEANETKIFYMNDFASLGWMNHLSCDRTGTGGWTDDVGLHVVVPNYDSLTDEDFQINFLVHESQHYADKRRYKDLADWELEYRAKLVELAYAAKTKDRTLSGFTNNQGDDIDDAHSYANKRVLIAIRQRLGLAADAKLADVPVASLHEAALSELRADSARRLNQLK